MALPKQTLIDGVTYDILKLGKPLHCKKISKSALKISKFSLYDLSVLGVKDKTTYKFFFICWCTQAPSQKIINTQMLRDVIDNTVSIHGAIPEIPQDNRELVSIDGVDTYIPIFPELKEALQLKKSVAEVEVGDIDIEGLLAADSSESVSCDDAAPRAPSPKAKKRAAKGAAKGAAKTKRARAEATPTPQFCGPPPPPPPRGASGASSSAALDFVRYLTKINCLPPDLHGAAMRIL